MNLKRFLSLLVLLAVLLAPLTLVSATSGADPSARVSLITGLGSDSSTIALTPEEQAFLAAHPTIRAGVDPAFMPYEFIDVDGRYKGIAAEVLALVCQKTGLRITVRTDLPWTEAHAMAQRQELDLLPAVAKTDARLPYFLYTNAYQDFERALIYRDDNTSITGLDSLKGQMVAVQENSSHHGFLLAYPDTTLSLYKETADALRAVSEGRETVFVGNYGTSAYLIRTMGLMQLRSLKLRDGSAEQLHMAVRKDWPELVSILNKGLDAITGEEWITIRNRWIGIEQQQDYSGLLNRLFIAAGIAVIILLVSLYWIMMLRQEVKARIRVQEALKVAKEEAESANRIKSSFLARMSHEIRTPLHAVNGTVHLLRRTPLSTSQRLYTDMLLQASHSMLGIINDILDFSKIEAGKLSLEHISFNLDTVLQQAVHIVSWRAEEKKLKFEVHRDPALPVHYFGDPARLGQIILNLLGNAVKFTDKGTVSLTVGQEIQERDRKLLTIAVQDTGIGIPPEQLDKLFTPFTQADASINRKYGGTGLGLSIVQSLLEQMGGTVTVESKANEGTRFLLHLPLQPDMERETMQQQWLGSAFFRNLKVLGLHNDPEELAEWKRVLKAFGMEAGFSLSVQDAQARLQAGSPDSGMPFDLVLADVSALPTGGNEPLLALSQDLRLQKAPRFILLVPTGQEDTIAGQELEGDVLRLPKPMIPSMLFNAILTLFRDQLPTDNPAMEQPGEAEFHFAPGCCILVVDDNRTNLFITRAILEEAGAAVVLAEDGQAGLDAFLATPNRFSAILMDLHMPKMNGYEATERIRETDKKVPIIALTADAVTGVEENCRAAGFSGCVQKPFEPEQLLHALSAQISRVYPATEEKPEAKTNAEAMPMAEITMEDKAVTESATEDITVSDTPVGDTAMTEKHDMAPSTEILSLPLLDEGDGLRRLGNRRNLYETILETFLQEAEEEYPNLQELVDDKQWDEVVKSAHKIKGISGNVGAKRLQAQAAELQQAAAEAAPALEATAAYRVASIRETLDQLKDKIAGITR